MNHLKFNEHGFLVLTLDGRDGDDGHEITIRSAEQWNALLSSAVGERIKREYLWCGSSIDFPEDYTTNEDLIAICHRVRQ